MNFDRRLLALLEGRRRWLAGAVVFGILAAWTAVAQAWYLSLIIDRAFLQHEPLPPLLPWLGGYAGLALLRAAWVWRAQQQGAQLAFHVQQGLREELLDRLNRLGPAERPRDRSGELVNTLTQGIHSLEVWFGEYLPQFFRAICIPLSLLFLIIPLDWISGAILLVTAPLIPFFMILIGSLAQRRARRQWQTLSRLSAYFLDVLQGLSTLKLLGLGSAETLTITQVTQAFRQATLQVLKVAFLSALVLELLATLSTALIAVSLGLRLLHGQLPFQEALFVLILAPDFYLPLRQLGARFHAGMAGVTAAERLFELGERKPAVAQPTAERPLPMAPFSIALHEVSYAYADGSRPALKGLSLELKPDEVTVLIGPSGAGKSTVAQLLLGFLPAPSGVVRVNGRSLTDFSLQAWRDQIAWIPQRPFLFHASIADNLRLARPTASSDELYAALRAAGLESTVRRLPQTIDTQLGERGSRLSGGEAQRLALARAFLKKAPVLILDEPTSQLDPEQEDAIGETLAQLMQGRTTLLITHRLALLRDPMHVIVLANGQMLEEGTAAELRLRQGWLARVLKGEPPA